MNALRQFYEDYSFLILLGIMLIFLSIFYFTCSSDVPDKPRAFNEAFANMHCEDFIKKDLKSPSTATFASMRDVVISKDSREVYTVRTYVDSQNSYGAMIRTNCTCRVKHNKEEGSVILVSLDFD